jgi:hypothetical protein
MTMTESKKAATLILSALLMAIASLWLPPSVARADVTVIKDLRTGSDRAYVRLVLETDRALTQAPELSLDGNTLRIALADIDSDLPQIGSEAYRHDIDRINLFRTSDATLIEAVFSFVPADVRTFTLASPFRFVVDIYRPLSSIAAKKPTDATSPQARLAGKNGTPPPIINEKQPPPGSHLESAADASGSIDPEGNNPGDADRNRFQQRLLAILIIVTSIILVVILILMCVDRKRV